MFSLQFFHIPKILSPAYGKKVCKALEKVVQIPQEGIVNIIVVPPGEMAWMNEQYRGKEGPTDILTFSYLEPLSYPLRRRGKGIAPLIRGDKGGFDEKGEEETIGEIYLCLEKIQTYAKESGRSYKEQLEYIVIHGLVHLLGFDHETAKDSQKMEEVERKIFTLAKGTVAEEKGKEQIL